MLRYVFVYVLLKRINIDSCWVVLRDQIKMRNNCMKRDFMGSIENGREFVYLLFSTNEGELEKINYISALLPTIQFLY